MNAVWHRRRAKAEIRRGADIKNMPHSLHLKISDLTYMGVIIRIELKD